MLTPVVRFCLRRSLRIQDLLEGAKYVFLAEAAAEIVRSGKKVNLSRLSATTGIHRRDVMRIYERAEVKEEPMGMISKVIGLWQQDPRFCSRPGKARVLTAHPADGEFKQLVTLVSNDLNHATVLFELERVGAVKRVRDGVKLVMRAYVPRGDVIASYRILARDSADLMVAVDQNATGELAVPNLQAKTEFDRIAADAVPKVRAWLMREGSALHQKARNFLSKLDLDVNRRLDSDQPVVRVALGTFSLVEEVKQTQELEKE
jgi:hypothetical protein